MCTTLTLTGSVKTVITYAQLSGIFLLLVILPIILHILIKSCVLTDAIINHKVLFNWHKEKHKFPMFTTWIIANKRIVGVFLYLWKIFQCAKKISWYTVFLNNKWRFLYVRVTAIISFKFIMTNDVISLC